MKRPRGNRTSKAHRAERQQRGVELINEGVPTQQIAAELGCSPIEIWKSKLVSIPRETESEVLERLNEAFTMNDLRRFGLADLFHEQRRSPRLMALRSIASNTKRLLLGSS